jgi:hypothetical protein
MGKMTRAEHFNRYKQRALEYVRENDIPQAVASMCSDLGKHPETRDHIGCGLGVSLLAAGYMNTSAKAKEWIEGFN